MTCGLFVFRGERPAVGRRFDAVAGGRRLEPAERGLKKRVPLENSKASYVADVLGKNALDSHGNRAPTPDNLEKHMFVI